MKAQLASVFNNTLDSVKTHLQSLLNENGLHEAK